MTTSDNARTPGGSGISKKPKRRRRDSDDMEVLHAQEAQAGGRGIVVLASANDHEPSKLTKAKSRRRRNAARSKDKELIKLDKLFLRAWTETYESRRRKLD